LELKFKKRQGLDGPADWYPKQDRAFVIRNPDGLHRGVSFFPVSIIVRHTLSMRKRFTMAGKHGAMAIEDFNAVNDMKIIPSHARQRLAGLLVPRRLCQQCRLAGVLQIRLIDYAVEDLISESDGAVAE
jgi:hypothetical protein